MARERVEKPPRKVGAAHVVRAPGAKKGDANFAGDGVSQLRVVVYVKTADRRAYALWLESCRRRGLVPQHVGERRPDGTRATHQCRPNGTGPRCVAFDLSGTDEALETVLGDGNPVVHSYHGVMSGTVAFVAQGACDGDAARRAKKLLRNKIALPPRSDGQHSIQRAIVKDLLASKEEHTADSIGDKPSHSNPPARPSAGVVVRAPGGRGQATSNSPPQSPPSVSVADVDVGDIDREIADLCWDCCL